jgi:hypothetical protein
MKVYGFRGWDWEPDGFVAGLPANFSGMPSIEPTILERPGGFATFGPSSIREMTIPVEFIYQSHEPGNDLTYEEAYRYLFKRTARRTQRHDASADAGGDADLRVR